MAEARHQRQKLTGYLRKNWAGVGKTAVRWLIIFVIASLVLSLLLERNASLSERLNAFLVVACCLVSVVYLLFISSEVHLRLPGIELRPDEKATIQVSRLGAHVGRVVVTNDAPVPVLRAQTTVTLAREQDNDVAPVKASTLFAGEPFSLGAHGTRPARLAGVFNHVGIYELGSAGVRVYSLFGTFSRVREAPGHWRVRVVPNVYRLAYGIPRDRTVSQDSLGLPSTPADALDYDRVRDYRPGDQLKVIHWKMVAHGQGELYTKLFETPTITSFTLAFDPYGPSMSQEETALHLHDTMLEGGFSLVEHAREQGTPGKLRYARRDGSLVQVPWAGPAMLGTFVETFQRPSLSKEAQEESTRLIRSLKDRKAGYVVFATSLLTPTSVEELIACHHAGVPLLVVHALPSSSSQGGRQQRALDRRLQEVSIVVVQLEDGPQIVREVGAS